MDYKSLLNILVALFNLIFGIIIFLRAQKRSAHIFFSFISFGISFWAVCMAAFRFVNDHDAGLIWAKFLYIPPILIVTLFLTFTYVFPNKPMAFKTKTHGNIYLVSGVMTLLVLLPGGIISDVILTPGHEHRIIFGPVYPLYFLMIPTFFIWSFLRLNQKQKYSQGLRKTQIQFVLYGTLISANLGLFTNLILPTFGLFKLNWMGPVFTLIMVTTIGYAIVRHRLMDIRSPFSKNLAYTFFLIATFSAYSFLILMVYAWFKNLMGVTIALVSGSVLMALGFEPIKRFIEKTTNRIFYKKNYDPQQLLTELNRAIHSIIDLNRILTSIRQIVMDHFNLERMGIFLIDERLSQFDLKEEAGLLKLDPVSFLNPIVRGIEEKNKTMLVYENMLDDTGKIHEFQPLLEEMESRGISVVSPLYSDQKLIGLYFFGPKKSGDYFTGLDLQILEIISAQTGTTIENARLYQQINYQMDELKKTQMQQLVQAAKLSSIGELATSVAHEINNPLTGILGFASLLLKEMDDRDPKKRDVKVIESEALRTRSIVHSLLDFARQREPRRERVNINETLKATLVLIRHQSQISNVELIEQYKEPLPEISVDVDQMKQVFINLIKNAFDAMPNGGKLYIKTNLLLVKGIQEKSDKKTNEEEENVNHIVEITFSDIGMGMTHEVLARIFEPFYTTKGEKSGTGLGLPVSYGIIERHGGQIEVQSTLGRGTTFKIKLPVS
ncbi:MAG: ATP-binding protein [Nitrospiria bacterium]